MVKHGDEHLKGELLPTWIDNSGVGYFEGEWIRAALEIVKIKRGGPEATEGGVIYEVVERLSGEI